jgi:hypothetical protein
MRHSPSAEHANGNERLWWQELKIDPLAVAMRLWRESQQLPEPVK